jgi:thioredoxin 1
MVEAFESNFEELTREGVVLVDFYTDWCGPCRVLAPTLEKLEGVKVVKVNTEDNMNLAVKFRVSSIPCLVFMKDGLEVNRMVGVQSQDVLQENVNKLLVEDTYA